MAVLAAAPSTASWVAEKPARAQTDVDKILLGAPASSSGSAPSSSEASTATTSAKTLPEIAISTEVGVVLNAAEAALLAHSPRPIYERDGRLVRVLRASEHVEGKVKVSRAREAATIDLLPEAALHELMADSARWVTFKPARKDGAEVKEPALPPGWAVRDLAARGEWTFPSLEGIATAPFMRPDGTICSRPGLDPATAIYLDPRGVDFGMIPAEPTHDDARAALAELKAIVFEFPFADRTVTPDREARGSGIAAALAMILTPFARPAIDSTAPCFLVSATDAGTGKTLLARLVGLLALGHRPALLPPVERVEEERKRLLAILMSGDPLVIFDNVERFGGAPIDAFLTSEFYGDRVLGETKKAAFSTRSTTMIATGNNVSFVGDTGRRVIPIELDAAYERPDTRTGFTHNPLDEYVMEHRPRLVRAALTILRAYQVSDAEPPTLEAFGSFERWSRFVREPLAWLGEDDPCMGRARLLREADPVREAQGVLVAAWRECFGEDEVTVAEVIKRATPVGTARVLEVPNARLRDALIALAPHSDLEDAIDRSRLGTALNKFKGKVLSGLRLESGVRCRENGQDARKWRVVVVARPSPDMSRGGRGGWGGSQQATRARNSESYQDDPACASTGERVGPHPEHPDHPAADTTEGAA
jgi:hypothetical protein